MSKSQPAEASSFLLDLPVRFDLMGITVPEATEETSSIQVGEDVSVIGSHQLRYILSLPRDLVGQVEKMRTNDVPLSISLQVRYLSTFSLGPGVSQAIRPAVLFTGQSFEISESKWLALLTKMGYHAAWLMEVPRPRIEGWNETIAFLANAEERIASHDPEGAIGQCRAAWKSLQPLLEASWSKIAVEIDRGSKSEEDQPAKSKRVESLWRDVLKFSNTGSHPEYYAATMEDAHLAYQTTCSAIAYLSRKYVDAEKHEPK